MPAAKNLVNYGSKTCTERLVSDDVVKHGPKRCLTPEQEFFLVLVRLRLGLMEVDLAQASVFPSRKSQGYSSHRLIFCILGYGVTQYGQLENLSTSQCQQNLERCIPQYESLSIAQSCL